MRWFPSFVSYFLLCVSSILLARAAISLAKLKKPQTLAKIHMSLTQNIERKKRANKSCTSDNIYNHDCLLLPNDGFLRLLSVLSVSLETRLHVLCEAWTFMNIPKKILHLWIPLFEICMFYKKLLSRHPVKNIVDKINFATLGHRFRSECQGDETFM